MVFQTDEVTTASGDLHPAGAKPSLSAVSEATVFNNSPSVTLRTIVVVSSSEHRLLARTFKFSLERAKRCTCARTTAQ